MHTIEKLSEEFVRRTRAESEKQQQTDVKNHDGIFFYPYHDSLLLLIESIQYMNYIFIDLHFRKAQQITTGVLSTESNFK